MADAARPDGLEGRFLLGPTSVSATALRSVVRIVHGWVQEHQVERALTWLSHFVGYSFDESDWSAISQALPQTDSEKSDGWYEYPLAGRPRLDVSLAREVGAVPVMIRVAGEFDDVLEARVDTLLSVLADC